METLRLRSRSSLSDKVTRPQSRMAGSIPLSASPAQQGQRVLLKCKNLAKTSLILFRKHYLFFLLTFLLNLEQIDLEL